MSLNFFNLFPSEIYRNPFTQPTDGINTLPSFKSNQENEKDSDLKYYQNLLQTPEISSIFEKPRLTQDWIDDYKKKLKWQEDYDFDTFVTSVIGSTTDKELNLLNTKFPDIIKKKELPPLSNLELHKKIAKLIIRGMKNEEDFVLTYLIFTEQVLYNSDLLNNILMGIGYTSQDKEMSQDININGPIRHERDYQRPPVRIPPKIDPFQVVPFNKSNYERIWGKNTERFNEPNPYQGNVFGPGRRTENRYRNSYFLNLLK